MTTIVICDERRTVLEELARALNDAPGVSRIGSMTRTDERALRSARDHADVVLFGLQDGSRPAIAAIKRLTRPNGHSNVLVLGGERDCLDAAAAIAHGARGYLRCDAIAAMTPAPMVPAPRAPHDTPTGLSQRELQVLRGMAQGKSNGRIGKDLYLSEDTIKTHARHLFKKLGAKDRAQAVAQGFRQGLLT